MQDALYDPQTSGGLLIAVDAADADALAAELQKTSRMRGASERFRISQEQPALFSTDGGNCLERTVNFHFGGKPTEGQTHRSARERTKRAVRTGRAVQAAAREDAEALFERYRDLRIVLSRKSRLNTPTRFSAVSGPISSAP